MSNFYNQQRHYPGPIAKKPRMAPRGPHTMPNSMHPEEDSKRLYSFKEFVMSQRNDINEQEALKRYSDYKTDFTRRQIDQFFKAHQEEEWFRNKYRPIELQKFEELTKERKAKRKEIYQKIMDKVTEESLTIDYDHNESLSKFLEDFSLMLEGASLEELENEETRKNYSVSSIFIPNLHASVDKAMVEEYASQHPGFLRVAMSDAQPERGYGRRAWITYKHMDANSLKLLCWEFNTHKFNDGQETKANINKEMNNRIRYSSSQFWSSHSKVAKADLKNVARILSHFDGEDCPLLETIKDNLIEEISEEEQVLGVKERDDASFEFTRDPEILKALDRIILYLRVVHSFDYYAATEYSGEDDMPQRIGIMHARPTPPSNLGDNPAGAVQELIEARKTCIDSYIEKPVLSETEQTQLGKRNPEEAVENYIYQHTSEKVPGEKYVCLLTKKKFTSPEFVRKHIFNRCGDRLDEVRKNVAFFNNYVADPRRPM